MQVWHSGTLASTLVGSTRRMTISEIEARAAETRGDGGSTSDSNSWWLDVNTGGKLMVRGKGGGGGSGDCSCPRQC